MGSRGTFLKSGGFTGGAKWEMVDHVGGIKVLLPIGKTSRNLPERSNTPGTAYLLYRKDGVFDQLRVFGADRVPLFDIDYGVHDGKKFLHVHYFKNGERAKKDEIVALHKGDVLYERYKHLFKGVPL